MNWSEGALSRHSRGRGWSKDAAQQKKYFEQARARAIHSSSDSRSTITKFVPSFIPQGTQAELHPTGWPSPHSLTQSPRIPRNQRSQLFSLASSSSDSPERSSSQHTDLSRLGKRSRAVTDTASESAPAKLVDIDSKRRKLLEKSDWSGVRLQKPIEIDWVWHGERNRPHNHISHIVSPRHVVPKSQLSRGLPNVNPSAKQRPSQKLDRSMKIRIGNDCYRWSEASGSVRSLSSAHGRLHTLQDWGSSRGTPSSPYTPSHASQYRTSIERMSSETSFPPYSGNQLNDRIGHVLQHERHRAGESLGNRSVARNVDSGEIPPLFVASRPREIHHPIPIQKANLSMLEPLEPQLQTFKDSESVIVQPDIPSDQCRSYDEDVEWNNWLHSGLPKSSGARPVVHSSMLAQSASPSSALSVENSLDAPEISTSMGNHLLRGLFGQNDYASCRQDDLAQYATKARLEAQEQTKCVLQHPPICNPRAAVESASVRGDRRSPCPESKDGVPNPTLAQASYESINNIMPADNTQSSSAASATAGYQIPNIFHPPRAFIGRLASQETVIPQIRDVRGQGRGKRLSGRPDIRAVPDFEGDPIEEIS